MVLGWLPDPALTGQSMLLVLAAVLLAVVVSYATRSARLVPAYALVRVTHQVRYGRPAYVRLTDPDAAGCHRPRAPAFRSPAA
jgi:hypothetical protein